MVKEIIGKTQNYSIVFGLPFSGKTFLNKQLATNQGYEIIDLNEVTKKLREKRNPEDPESVELVAKDLIDEVALVFESYKINNKRLLLENIVNPLLPEFDNVKQLLQILGIPRQFYHVKCEDKELKLRYKRIKLENTSPEDLNEGELEEYQNTLILPNKIIAELEGYSYKTIIIDTTKLESITKEALINSFSSKIICIKHEYNKTSIENVLSNLATEYQALYINVPKLIYDKFYENNETAVELKKYYAKKVLKNSNNLEELSFDQKVYYKYNPIHFDEEGILNLIKNHINDNILEIENSGLVFLTGFINYDLLTEENKPYCLSLKEIQNILILGKLLSFIQVTSEKINVEEQLEEVLLEPPKKPVKKKDDLDVSGNNENNEDGNNKENNDGGNMEENMEENMEGGGDEGDGDDPENQKPYNPFNKSWTDYNGAPRNYLQVLKRYLNKDITFDNINRSVDIIGKISELLKEIINAKDDVADEENNSSKNEIVCLHVEN